MQCGVSIPLDDVAKAVADGYSEMLADSVAEKLDLSKYALKDNGELNSPTLRGSITTDDAAKQSIGDIAKQFAEPLIDEKIDKYDATLEDKITAKLAEMDNRVSKFSIDKANNNLVITLHGGETFTVSKAELESWLVLQGGGIQSGTLNGYVLNVTNKDGTTTPIDLSGISTTVRDGIEATIRDIARTVIDQELAAFSATLDDKILASLNQKLDNQVVSFSIDDTNNLLTVKMASGQTFSVSKQELEDWLEVGTGVASAELNGESLVLTNHDGTQVTVDLSSLHDTHITGGSIVNGNTIRLTNNDGGTIDIDASTLNRLTWSSSEW